jgi:hypothetical protein
MTVRENLIVARHLISDPKRWTQGLMARDAAGHPACDGDAVCFCAVGALVKVTSDIDWRALNVLDSAARSLGFDGIVSLNDRADHPTVLRAYDLAIQNAEASA